MRDKLCPKTGLATWLKQKKIKTKNKNKCTTENDFKNVCLIKGISGKVTHYGCVTHNVHIHYICIFYLCSRLYLMNLDFIKALLPIQYKIAIIC